jgi:hypothetical protein
MLILLHLLLVEVPQLLQLVLLPHRRSSRHLLTLPHGLLLHGGQQLVVVRIAAVLLVVAVVV